MDTNTIQKTQYGIWVPSTVGHWHLFEGKPMLFNTLEEADRMIPNVQVHYYFKCESRKYEKITYG